MFIVANIIEAVARVAHMLIEMYIIVVVAACCLSWFRVDPTQPVVSALRRLTEPVFAWCRRHFSFLCSGGLDLSPVAVIIALELVDMIVVKSVSQLAMAL